VVAFGVVICHLPYAATGGVVVSAGVGAHGIALCRGRNRGLAPFLTFARGRAEPPADGRW